MKKFKADYRDNPPTITLVEYEDLNQYQYKENSVIWDKDIDAIKHFDTYFDARQFLINKALERIKETKEKLDFYTEQYHKVLMMKR